MKEPTPTFHEEDRALLERGYPHLRILVDEHEDDAPKKIAKVTAKVVASKERIHHVRWPRGVAARFVHLFAHVKDRRERAAHASEAHEPPSAAETEEMIARVCVESSTELVQVYSNHAEDFVLLLEAFVGTAPVVRGIVAGLVAAVREQEPLLEAFRASWDVETQLYTAHEPDTNYLAAYMVLPLGALLLRADEETAKKARADLGALVDAYPASVKVWPLAQIGMLLRGRAWVAKTSYRWHPPIAFLFSGDRAYIRESVAALKGEHDVDAYAIWYGGEEVLVASAKQVRAVNQSDADHVAEGIGMFASPHAVPYMVALAAKKSARAEAWLHEHMDLAGPELERIAKAGKKLGDAAAAILTAHRAGEVPTTKKVAAKSKAKAKPPTPAEIEAAFDRVTDDIVAAIDKVRGDAQAEVDAWTEAAASYIDARGSMLNEGDSAYMTHFFMVDGIAFSKARPTAFARLAPTDEEAKRWGKALEE